MTPFTDEVMFTTPFGEDFTVPGSFIVFVKVETFTFTIFILLFLEDFASF